MAQRGDSFIYELRGAYSDWGRVRNTDTREPIAGEGYIPISAEDARAFNVLNHHGTNDEDILGLNIFRCRSADGMFSGTLLAQGNQHDKNYAKQFSVQGNLQPLGRWYQDIGAQAGDRILVRWENETDIVIEKL